MSETPVRLQDLITHVTGERPDGSALEHVSDAVLVSEHLGELADDLVAHFVDRARRASASWAEIGQSMGVSKQAAQKRFVPKKSEASELLDGLLGDEVFAQFTDRARRVLVRAQEEARRARHNYIDAEHLVLGLLDDPGGLAATTIQTLGVSPEKARETVSAALGPEDPGAMAGRIPFTPRAKKVLQLSLREALRLGHNYIGTEHLLLGVIREGKGAAARALKDLGVTGDRTEKQIITALNEIQQRRRKE